MKQQRLFGFFHQFTPEGRSESARASPIQSPRPSVSRHDPGSPSATAAERRQLHDAVSTVEQHESLEVPHGNPRSRQVSEASSIGSKRSRDDDADTRPGGSPARKISRKSEEATESGVRDASVRLLNVTSNEQDAPSSSNLTVLSHTPSITSRKHQSFVRSSQDSDSDELELQSSSQPTAPSISRAKQFLDRFQNLEAHLDPDSDSDSSLGDLQGFTPKHKRQVESPKSSPKSPPPVFAKAQTRSAQRTTRTGVGTVQRQDYYEPHYFDPSLFDEAPPSEPVAKFSLARLLKQHQKEDAQQMEIARHLQALEAAQQEHDSTTREKDVPSKDTLLASLVSSGDADGNADRLKMALGRIEAMRTSTSWRFFDLDATPLPVGDAADFPAWKMADDAVWCHLCDPTLRAHAFLTGFATDCIRRNQCPKELRQWLWASALTERRQDLAEAYMLAFQASSTIGPSLSQVQDALRQMGACEVAISPSGQVKPDKSGAAAHRDQDFSAPATARLPLLLDCIRHTATYLDDDTRTQILVVLLKMGIDADLTANLNVKLSLQGCVQAIVDSFRGDESIERLDECSQAIFENIKSTVLRSRLIAALPDTSQRLHLFKQRLALAFYLDDDHLLHSPLGDTANLDKTMAEKLNVINVSDESVDYAAVAAQVSLLDVGMGAGFPQSQADGTKSEEQFNASVDIVSRSVKQLFARIVDTGASHMARTEAKGTLERLRYRLDFGVRSRPPARLNIYEDVMVGRGLMQDKQGAAFLAKFLRPAINVNSGKDGAAAAPVQSAV